MGVFVEKEIEYLEKVKRVMEENEGFIVSNEEPDIDVLIKQKKREV